MRSWIEVLTQDRSFHDKYDPKSQIAKQSNAISPPTLKHETLTRASFYLSLRLCGTMSLTSPCLRPRGLLRKYFDGDLWIEAFEAPTMDQSQMMTVINIYRRDTLLVAIASRFVGVSHGSMLAFLVL